MRRPSATRRTAAGGSPDDPQDLHSPLGVGAQREPVDDNYFSESEFFEKGEIKLKLRNFDGTKADWFRWKKEVMSIASMNGFASAFERDEPIQCIPLDVQKLRSQGVPIKDIRRAQKAWCLLLTHITNPSVKDMVFNAGSPSVVWKKLDK